MSSKYIKRAIRVMLALSATAAVVTAVLLSPGVVLGLTATLQNNKEAASQPPNYKLGEVVIFSSEINFAGGETRNITKVHLKITGPQPLEVDLPVEDTGGAFVNWTSLLPKDAGGNPLGKLFVKMETTNVTYNAGYGYWVGGPSGGKIKYTIRYWPPIFKYPPPPPLPGPINHPDFAFAVPGGAGGGGPATVTATPLFPIPFVPGVVAGSEPRGLFWDPGTGQLLVLMDGTPVDVLLFVDPFSGWLIDFMALSGISDATGVAVSRGDVFVLREGPAGKKIVRVVDNPPTGDTLAEVVIPDTIPGGDVTSDGLFLHEVDWQPIPGAGIPFRDIDPGTGTVSPPVVVPDAPSGGGYDALTVGGPLGGWLGGFEEKIVHFDGTGFVMEVAEVDGLGDIQGLALDPGYGGPGARLLVADGDTATIYEVIVGAGGGGGGGGGMLVPRAIAGGGADPFYILVDDTPVDRVLVTDNAGHLLNDFDVVSGNVESLVLFGGKLFYVDNAPHPKVLHRAAVDGTDEADNSLPVFVGEIGDLTTDGVNLFAVERWSDTVHKIAPKTTGSTAGTVVGSFPISDSNPSDPFWPPGGLEAAVWTPPYSPSFLIGGKYGTTWRMDPATGGVVGGDYITPGPPWDLTGMVLVPGPVGGTSGGSTICMTDAATQAVYCARVPGAPDVDPTAVGNYQAKIQVFINGSPTPHAESALSNFTLEKVTTLVVDITSPTDGQGFGTPDITVQGTVNDPTVKTVTVGVGLPEAILFGNADKTAPSDLTANTDRAQYGVNGLWQFIDFNAAGAIPGDVDPGIQAFLHDIAHDQGTVAWYGKFAWPYGPSRPNYNTDPMPNVGDLDTSSMTLTTNATLGFDTWYETDFGFIDDQKLIQWCTGATCQNIAQIVPDFPLVSTGFGFMPDFSAAPGTVWQAPPGTGYPTGWKMVYVPMSRTNSATGKPQFTHVELDLSALGVTGSGRIRFKFDTMNPWGNDWKGWMVDNAIVKGAAIVGTTATVNPLTLEWSATFTLAEGENAITASATRDAYDPILTDTDTVNVFLDTRVPTVSINAGVTPTNIVGRIIQVTYNSATPDELVVRQQTASGTRTVLTKRTGFTPPTQTIDVPVALEEGSNVLTAILTNASGLSGSDSKTVVLDTTPPTLTVLSTIYPVGEVSARPGDMTIFQANAADAGTGINRVEFIAAGMASYEPFVPAAEIPEAVRDQWGTTGGYLLPMELPGTIPPGTWSITLRAVDNAGNKTPTTTASALVVATLQAYNIYLMPNHNLVSLPLQPTVGTDFDIATLLTQPVPNANPTWAAGLGHPPTLADVIETISYFTGGTAATGTWQVYTTDESGDSLTVMTTGKGYWIKAKDAAFKRSAPLAPGLPETPAPIKLTIVGQVLRPGEVPPTYSLSADWNLVGLHSEKRKTASQFLRGVSVPTIKWASLLEYQNYLKFERDEEPEIKLGAFNSLFDTDYAEVGRGFWLFMVEPNGKIVP